MWLVMLAVIFGGFFLTWWTGTRAEKEIKAELMSRARIIAGSVNSGRIANLKGSQEDLSLPDYNRLKEQLCLIRHVIPQYGVLYLLGRQGDEIFVQVDSEIPGSELYSPPGTPYDWSGRPHMAAFSSGKEQLSGPYEESSGKWMTAIVPIYNRDTSGLVSLFCMDVDSRIWSEKIIKKMLEPVLFTVFITLVLVFYFIFHRHYDNAQRLLALSEEYMQLAIEGSGLATWEWNLVSGNIESNDRFSQLIGYEKSEIMVKLGRWHHLVHPDEKEHLQKILDENLFGQATYFEEEHRLRHKSGAWIWVLNKGRVMERTRDGLPIRIAGTIMDISGRKMSEKALKESEARFRRIFEESPLGIELFNSEAVLIEVNRACLDILGVGSAEEIKGLSAYDDPNLQSLNFDLVKTSGTTKLNVAYDFDMVKERGHYRTRKSKTSYLDVFVSSMNISEKPEDCEFLVHIQDMTEKIKAEEERQNLEKRLQAARKMESLGLLAGGVAHDFNNILGALQGFAEMALEIVDEQIPDSPAGEYLMHVLKASERASSLVEQILTFSRKTDSIRKPLDIAVLAKETVKLIRPTMPLNIKIESFIANDCGRVLADPAQIHQVIMNLCTNARQAMEENGGILRMEISRSGFGEKYAEDPGGEYVRLVVSDTGGGIAKENFEKIFDPFFTTKKPGEGIGLGLSVVHGIVVSCDGYIMLESTQGQGTSFYVYFPEAGGRSEAGVIASEETLRMDGRPPRAMLVDDERALLGMMTERLSAMGLEVSSFFDPWAALNFFREKHDEFDIVISDSDMTSLSGVELAKKMRQMRPCLPIILMAGRESWQGDDAHAFSGITSPCGVITKPVSFYDLFEYLKTFLAKGASF